MTVFRCHSQKLAIQGGAALLAGLVILAAISLLALVATASMLLQRRMASNFSDAQSARQAAAAAVSREQHLYWAWTTASGSRAATLAVSVHRWMP
jgi:Tfp pilus assembly protein PilX